MAGFEEFPSFSENHSDRTRSVFTHRNVTLYPISLNLKCFLADCLFNKKFVESSLIKRLIVKFECFASCVKSAIRVLVSRELRRLNALDRELDKSAKHMHWISEEISKLQGIVVNESDQIIYPTIPYESVPDDLETFTSDEKAAAINLLNDIVLPSWEEHYKSIEKLKVRMNVTLGNIRMYLQSHELTDIL